MKARTASLFNFHFSNRESWSRLLLEKLRRVIHTIQQWEMVSRERKHLAELPSHILKDLGLTEYDRAQELNKHFWQR
ncbi:DUF1127 domain-containing protein [Hahella sp. CCB-MM4]|uniref:DUF1127 domain-containing protein n=1 Tax=Hahella sp. (strain CCB-MM4) TaxID=1926491 RepID=UPI000B9AD2BB|nr:DUF1127 domain-containing protein [Hahella sp. CCB-MM4]